MYDEFDNKENEDRYDPKQPSAEDEVKTGQMYGEEDQLSETEEVQASIVPRLKASYMSVRSNGTGVAPAAFISIGISSPHALMRLPFKSESLVIGLLPIRTLGFLR